MNSSASNRAYSYSPKHPSIRPDTTAHRPLDELTRTETNATDRGGDSRSNICARNPDPGNRDSHCATDDHRGIRRVPCRHPTLNLRQPQPDYPLTPTKTSHPTPHDAHPTHSTAYGPPTKQPYERRAPTRHGPRNPSTTAPTTPTGQPATPHRIQSHTTAYTAAPGPSDHQRHHPSPNETRKHP